ncbi:uracil-DNA glycosylase [Citricoccus sp. SGAir0253]|uniref:uracil-DNA glycosylase n=1 Tax=Citricoccus sp. SGAir0253 TaxID=2567881 RepID=UPI00143D9209|nr:uracil-DNA glycosylase [Citricoccus sp. SGAir0253]
MSDPAYLTDARNHLHGEHIAPITELCQSLEDPAKGPVPYLDPAYDVDEARILVLTAAPGEGTASGFLSHENDDDASERLDRVLRSAGLAPRFTIPWTVHPWTQEGYALNLTRDQITAGLKPFKRFLKQVPRVVAIMAHGGEAQKLLKAFSGTIGGTVLEEKAIRVFALPAVHAQGGGRKAAPEEVEEQMVEAYGQAMRLCGVRPVTTDA